jgi:hypothetical protein
MRGDSYVKRDSNLYHASDSINYPAINDYSRYLELVVLINILCKLAGHQLDAGVLQELHKKLKVEY